MRALPGRLSRRRFLSTTLAALAGWVVLPRAIAPGPDAVDAWLRHLAAQLPAGATLGRRYLADRPEEASAAWLASSLFGADMQALGGPDALEAARRRLLAARAADFRDGRLLVLECWTLTATEARLLALLALRAG
jgi:hypothetical protein